MQWTGTCGPEAAWKYRSYLAVGVNCGRGDSLMEQDSFIRRIQESVSRLVQAPEHMGEPETLDDGRVRKSVRQLSRSRVSQLLRQLRAAHGYSYAQVQADTGLSQQILFDVEFKDRRLTLDELRRLAACYQVSVDDILGVDIDLGSTK